eukprot:5006966-Prymnesium_polylepis.1
MEAARAPSSRGVVAEAETAAAAVVAVRAEARGGGEEVRGPGGRTVALGSGTAPPAIRWAS